MAARAGPRGIDCQHDVANLLARSGYPTSTHQRVVDVRAERTTRQTERDAGALREHVFLVAVQQKHELEQVPALHVLVPRHVHHAVSTAARALEIDEAALADELHLVHVEHMISRVVELVSHRRDNVRTVVPRRRDHHKQRVAFLLDRLHDVGQNARIVEGTLVEIPNVESASTKIARALL